MVLPAGYPKNANKEVIVSEPELVAAMFEMRSKFK
jgi:hypothetical protein